MGVAIGRSFCICTIFWGWVEASVSQAGSFLARYLIMRYLTINTLSPLWPQFALAVDKPNFLLYLHLVGVTTSLIMFIALQTFGEMICDESFKSCEISAIKSIDLGKYIYIERSKSTNVAQKRLTRPSGKDEEHFASLMAVFTEYSLRSYYRSVL